MDDYPGFLFYLYCEHTDTEFAGESIGEVKMTFCVRYKWLGHIMWSLIIFLKDNTPLFMKYQNPF